MARDTSGGTVTAFLQRKSKRAGRREGGTPRYESDGRTLRVWGNKVAEWENGKIRLCDAGYQTLLTKNTLNALLDKAGSDCGIYQQRGTWRVQCAPGRTVPWPGCVTIKPR